MQGLTIFFAFILWWWGVAKYLKSNRFGGIEFLLQESWTPLLWRAPTQDLTWGPGLIHTSTSTTSLQWEETSAKPYRCTLIQKRWWIITSIITIILIITNYHENWLTDMKIHIYISRTYSIWYFVIQRLFIKQPCIDSFTKRYWI